MNRLLLSLCLLGAALSTANTLFFRVSTCPSEETKMTARVSIEDVPSPQPKGVTTPQAKRPQAQKAAATPPAAAPQDMMTGSLGGPKTLTDDETLAPGQFAKVGAEPSNIGDEEWAEVSVAAKVHSAPSVSAPTIRYYRVGTELRVIHRQPGWIKIEDPATSRQGWIYEKYLTRKDGPPQTQVASRQRSQPSARLRKQTGWQWHRAHRPKFRIVFGVYPRW